MIHGDDYHGKQVAASMMTRWSLRPPHWRKKPASLLSSSATIRRAMPMCPPSVKRMRLQLHPTRPAGGDDAARACPPRRDAERRREYPRNPRPASAAETSEFGTDYPVDPAGKGRRRRACGQRRARWRPATSVAASFPTRRLALWFSSAAPVATISLASTPWYSCSPRRAARRRNFSAQ